MKDLTVGIIGCGVIFPTHAEAFLAQPGVTVKWACDLDLEKAGSKAVQYGIPCTCADYLEVINDPDVDIVSVCTDHASHAPITCSALEHGKHVLCEKALSSSSEGLDQMLIAHSRHPQLVFAGIFQHRFDALNQYVRQLVEQKVFGTVITAGFRVYCRRTNEYYQADAWRGTWAQEGGGVMINQAVHYVDLLSWFMDGVESTCGTIAIRTHEGVIETEDTVTASLRFKCGALGTIEASSSSRLDWQPSLWIHGSEGHIEICNGKPVEISFENKAVESTIRSEMEQCRDQPGVKTRKSYYGTGHNAQIEDFISAVREARDPFITAKQASHAVDIVLAIYRSHHEASWVNIPHRS